ncbi:Arginine permease [Meyerozyma sp. JA9]|nr:Arginine permease [Meyerozyma sp. JA9]
MESQPLLPSVVLPSALPPCEVISDYSDPTSRSLTARQVTMLAIGGTVGTGLFVGVKTCLVQGPFIAIVAYVYVSSVCYGVIRALGEMSRVFPLPGSLCRFPAMFLSPQIGAANSGIYWFSWSMTLALELTILAQVLSFWFSLAHAYPQVVSFVIWLILTALNLLPVSYYAEVEFYITLVKVAALVLWTAICAGAILGFGTEAIGFHNWHQPWGTGILVDGPILSRILALMASLVSAAFTFQSSESVAITAGDMADPQTSIPKSVRAIYFRILVFYILSIVLLTLLVDASDPGLQLSDDSVFSSPFILALLNAGLAPGSALLHIINLVIFFSILSAANSNIYFGSRCFLALENVPKRFKQKSHRGVPVTAVSVTASFGLLSLATGFHSVEVVFSWLLNICACAGLLMWCCSAFSHVRFAAILSRKFDTHTSTFWSWYAGINTAVFLLVNGFVVFFNFTWSSFLASYLSVFLFIALWGIQWRPKNEFLVPLDRVVMQ